MSRKIIGVTVGTTTSPSRIAADLNPVKTVNGMEPDDDGNVGVALIVTDPNNDGNITLSISGNVEPGGSGGGTGDTGEPSGYYRPSVDANGVLSWTPSSSNMPSAESANMVNLVLAALPTWNGGSY